MTYEQQALDVIQQVRLQLRETRSMPSSLQELRQMMFAYALATQATLETAAADTQVWGKAEGMWSAALLFCASVDEMLAEQARNN